jgi:polar amino acid transport system substrate-binding protein
MGSTPDPLRIGVNDGYPPLSSVTDGKVEGIEADFGSMLGTELGTKVEFVPMALNDLIPALREKRVDIIMAGMSVTETRAEEVAFVEPYARVGQMALIRKSDYTKLRSPQAINWPTSRVGVKAGSTGATFAANTLRTAHIVEFDTVEEGVAALRAGKVDYFVHDAPTIWRVAGSPMSPDPELIGLYQPMTEEYLAWAVRSDATALRDRLNAIVLKWKTDGSISTVINRWVPIRKVAADPKLQP